MLTPMTPTGQPAKDTGSDPTAFDIQCAEALRKAIVAKVPVAVRWSRRDWADHVRRLRESNPAFTEEVILDALAWYTPRVGQDYIPEIFSADSFRSKFTQLLRHVEKDRKRNPKVEVSKLAHSVAAQFSSDTWHHGEEKQLPTFCQQTIDALNGLLAKLRAIARNKPGDDLGRLGRMTVDHLLTCLEVTNVAWAAEAWVKHVHSRLYRWSDNTRGLTPWVWSLDHSEAAGQLKERVVSYCQSTEVWDRLLKALKEEA